MKGKTFIKKAVSVFAAAAMSLSLVAGVPFDLIGTVVEVSASSGTCGENLTWSLDGGTLTISGEGAMADYSYSAGAPTSPWIASADAITNVVIGNGVTSIGIYAFSELENLTSVTIPSNVASIGSSAFFSCGALTSITIHSGVESIGNSAFANCRSLKAVTIPSGVTSIGDGAFKGCLMLEEVTIPSSVITIGNNAFLNCPDLETVTIPSSVTSIGSNAFASCTSLEEVNLPCNWDEENPLYTFDGNVSTIKADHDFEDGVCTVCGSTFTCGDNVNWILDNGTLTISGTGAMTDYSYGATPWYSKREEIQTVIIKNGVTTIGNSAFGGCSNLTSITIPTGVTSIGEMAFHSCSNLTSVVIPTGVTSIGERAFYNCSSLASVDISASVTSIGEDAFYGCGFNKEGSFRIPCGVFADIPTTNYDVKVIDLYHTNGCSHESGFMWGFVESGSFLNIYGEGTFSGLGNDGESPEDTSITSSVGDKLDDGILKIGYKVTSIDADAFAGCNEEITEVTAPDHFTVEELEALFPNAKDHITLYKTSYKPGSSGGGSSYRPTTSPDPIINGGKGWSDVVDEIEDSDDGDTIEIDMNGATKLSKDVLEEIEGKDITIVLDMGNGFTWTINGKDVKDPARINMEVKADSDGIPVKVINEVTGEKEYITISLTHSGEFGFKAVLSVNMGKENKGNYANLYYYNTKTGKTEFVSSGIIGDNGKADLTFTHASEYIIIIDSKDHVDGDLAAGESVKAEETILG